MKTLRCCLQIGTLLVAAAPPTRAGTFSSDFSTAPAGATLYGSAVIEATGGVSNSGCLKLTKAVNSQSGSFVIDVLDNGNVIYGFDVSYDVLLGGGTATPADGMSLCFGPDLPNGSWGEEGTGSGIIFSFDTYDNGNEVPLAPSIDVAIGGATAKVATRKYNFADMLTYPNFGHVHILLHPDGSLTMDFKGVNLFTNLFLRGYQPLAGRFGFGARTGGLNENCFVDNLQITTFTQPNVGISQQPFSQNVVQGDNATFDVRITNPNGVTLQWFKDGTAIAGANSTTLVVTNVQPAISGSKYKLTATGPNNTVTTTEVTLNVVGLTVPLTPQLSFNFDDGAVPAGTTTLGNALVDTTGGISNSGTLKLTANVNNQSGAFLISDPDAGAPVYGFTARFKMLVGGGTVPPADGFAFAFGNDIPGDPTTNSPNRFEEGEGLGTGLIVSFDIYNNDTIYGVINPTEDTPAPSMDVRYASQLVATRQFPVSFMETGTNSDGTPAFDDTIIQLNTDGTLNVVYRGDLVFDHLTVPGFGAIAGGRFAIAARSGGLNENMWVDNIQLTTITNSGALRIVSQPASQSILVNHSDTFSVGVNDTNGVTYQWLRNGTTLAGATSSSYTIPATALTDDGAVFSAQVTRGASQLTSSNAVLTVVNLTPPANPTLTFNFNDGSVPAGTAIYGNSSVAPTGGVAGSGVLHLTDAVNSENGAFVIQPVFNGAQVSSIAASFDIREGGGTAVPADGFSFNWAATLTDGVVGGAETGTGNGLAICFRIYVGNGNADNPPSPYIAVKYKGVFVASTQIPASQLDTGADYRTMLLRVDATGKLYLSYGERALYNGLRLTNYTFSAGKFGFYGRTGGLNENQWFDNILIQATQSSGPLTVTTQPSDVTVLAGETATFTVGLSDPNNATYQWSKNGATISAATNSSYTTPPTTPADSGSTFKVTATGPSGTAVSSNATLTVISPITITNPIVSYDFNDGLLPADTSINGSASITPDGGVTNSGCLHLTDAINGQQGTFVMPDFNTNMPVKALTVHFAMRIGGGTVPPADGVSFVWASSNDLPANISFGEGGTGTGLSVIFDLYNGANPYFGITYHGASVIQKFVPYQAMETGDNFADTFIRVNANGAVDVQYNGNVIFNHVQLPNYAPLAGGEFAFGARTGGLNENQWIDNIQIATTIGLTAPTLSFTRTGNSLLLTWGAGFKLQSTPTFSPANWTDVPNATPPYTATIGPGSLCYRLPSTP